MYLDHFNLKAMPFGLTPDPKFLYFTPSHREVLANLHYGIQAAKGLIVVTGEAGTGKTTLLRSILSRLDRSVLSSSIVNPNLTAPDFLRRIALDLGLGDQASKTDLLGSLGGLLAARQSRGLTTILFIDEAQGLSRELLEEVRLLLNFETDTAKQLQIVLSGQPELREKLNHPSLRQLKQRISLRCQIKPLKPAETAGYIRKRLKVAGAARLDLFSADAVELIARISGGVPRVINNICDNALLTAFALDRKLVTAAIAGEVCDALDLGREDRDETMTNAPAVEEDPRWWPQWSEEEQPVEPAIAEIKGRSRRGGSLGRRRD